MIAGAIALDLATAGAATPFEVALMGGLFSTGASMEAGAIANALTSNRGMGITTRQPAAYRQIVYGTQRIAGVEVYRSTTGSHKDQFNYVIVLSTHLLWQINALYLDGREVYWRGSGVGNSTRNGSNFGGTCDSNDHAGPNGQTYNFGGGVYCEASYGDQTNQPNTIAGGGFNTGLFANDPTWGPASNGNLPYLGGCAYVYLKIEYNTTNFPQEPEIRFGVKGKPVYDPRSGETAYSSNPALIMADALSDPDYGLGDSSINQAQLVAAANICDEQIATATAGNESRYTCHYHYDTGVGLGDALSTMLASMGGRLSRIGGEWYIWPAAFLAAFGSFGADHLTAPMAWEPTRAYRDLCNRVTGTYIAPNYPYNVAGDLYDSNGFYNGQIANQFPYGFQPTNYPQYACDVLHGYAADEYLNQDGGVQLVRDLNFSAVLSITQAQRLAKIELLRNRQQGTGKFQMNLAALQLQPCDTFLMTFAQNGWTQKLLEVVGFDFNYENGSDGTAPRIGLVLDVQETDASVYEWSTTEELTPYDVPALPSQVPLTVAAPTNIELISGAGTAVTQADGSVVPRIEVTWDTPLDVRVKQIQARYCLTPAAGAAPVWRDGGLIDVSLNTGYVGPVVAGQNYNVAIRSLRADGSASVWVELDNFTAGLVLNELGSNGMNPNSPYNSSNTATVDSIAENSAATIRIYGPGGDGTSFTRYLGAVPSTMVAAHITGQSFSTTYFAVFDTISQTYLALTSYNATLADQYIWIGQVITCASDYTGGSGSGGSGSGGSGGDGGSSGGGGGTSGGGRNPISTPVGFSGQ